MDNDVNFSHQMCPKSLKQKQNSGVSIKARLRDATPDNILNLRTVAGTLLQRVL